MSEEILKALMTLFAIISKQDEGTTDSQREFVNSFLSSQLNHEKVSEYMKLYDEKAARDQDEQSGEKMRSGKLTAMKDSVKTLAICRKINKTLSQKQKVVVLMRIFELLSTDELYTPKRMEIIETVSEVFNINAEELQLISNFSRFADPVKLDAEEILIVDSEKEAAENRESRFKYIHSEGLDGRMIFLRIKSADLYFVRYAGNSEITLNGLTFNTNNIYILPQGSTFRLPKGTLYYSDVVSRFLQDEDRQQISFHCSNVSFRFPGGRKALNNINLYEEFGMVGIMGASGSGKTTLINVLSGSAAPSDGEVTINGVDIHKNPGYTKGLVGYISQDDLLFEELTVFDNLYYAAKLCFRDLNNEEITQKVESTLKKLGLWEARDIKVGNPLNKKISGGQRKRLNIALELIREPSVLFVDEPTSGLSSRDSENVMDLLKQLSLDMKLIFVVIHQPSSDIFKMFDRLFLLDTGGFPIYYGNPIESVIYFKTQSNALNADIGECSSCGNVNPEMLFNIIESREVDEFGNFTSNRIKSPRDWNELYLENEPEITVNEIKDEPGKTLNIPGWFSQLKIFIKRDVLSKTGNLQYLLINLLEAPLLALVLTVIIKYAAGENGTYLFSENANIPPYIFMSITIALFIGLSVSAEEIFRDRKILKREAFLNLSRSGYLVSKVLILAFISAIQTLTYVLLGNWILEIRGLFFEYWIVLFACALFANMLGLNISSAFNSAVTIYILIPLLVIPQMILGGAMFSFDQLNTLIGGGRHTSPVIADFMVSRWGYEALAVTQFKNNRYMENFYDLEKIESQANFKTAYYLPELKRILRETENGKEKLEAQTFRDNIDLLRNEISQEAAFLKIDPEVDIAGLAPGSFHPETAGLLEDFIDRATDKYAEIFSIASGKKNKLTEYMIENGWNGESYKDLRDGYTNEFLASLVKKTTAPDKVVRSGNTLLQVADPIFQDPAGDFSFRSIFYAPEKNIFGFRVSTLTFNTLIIVVFTLLLYVTLYYDLLARSLNLFTTMQRSGGSGTRKKTT